ncbi:hypothetical protein L7F22_016713 [Adiantum nelumboides]|nr:hypothetical protein [Adiantum nelumboides]
MVVPLKLTQFYGHRVPRPRIYPEVKFNDQRVDPPPSVNEALLSWASEAHWSMGGLSFTRLRSQGKMEGNVRKLRAFLEEESDEEDGGLAKALGKKAGTGTDTAAEKVKSTSRKEISRPVNKGAHGKEELREATPAGKVTHVKEAKKPVGASGNLDTPTRKEALSSVEKRKFGEQELVEATPVRKMRRRGIVEESDDELPACVPATVERPQRGQSNSMAPVKGRSSAIDGTVKKASVQTPSVVPATVENREAKLASSKSLRGSESLKFARQSPEVSNGGRLTRSAKKTPAAQLSSVQVPRKVSRARKELMASDGESCEGDDGLEEFLKQKSRPLRRSSRLVMTEGTSFDSGSDLD